MTIDKKLDNNDGNKESFIDRVDNRIVDFHAKIGNYWQEKTDLSYNNLKTGLFTLGGAALFYAGVKESNYMDVLSGLGSLFAATTNGMVMPKNDVESDLMCESIGMPPKFLKYASAFVYTSSALFLGVKTSIGILNLIANNNMYSDHQIFNYFADLGYFAHFSGAYLHKTDLKSPPPKPKKKSIFDKLFPLPNENQ